MAVEDLVHRRAEYPVLELGLEGLQEAATKRTN
jgi:hypothetical protein